MAKSRNQKGKILVIEHLLQGTGESRIVTMQEILDKLLEYGITAERKSIYDDIEALREFGLDVQYKRGRPGGYYLAGGQEIAAAPESVHTKEEAGISKNAETEKKSEPVIIYKENTLDKEEIQNTEKAMKLQCDASREERDPGVLWQLWRVQIKRIRLFTCNGAAYCRTKILRMAGNDGKRCSYSETKENGSILP